MKKIFAGYYQIPYLDEKVGDQSKTQRDHYYRILQPILNLAIKSSITENTLYVTNECIAEEKSEEKAIESLANLLKTKHCQNIEVFLNSAINELNFYIGGEKSTFSFAIAREKNTDPVLQNDAFDIYIIQAVKGDEKPIDIAVFDYAFVIEECGNLLKYDICSNTKKCISSMITSCALNNTTPELADYASIVSRCVQGYDKLLYDMKYTDDEDGVLLKDLDNNENIEGAYASTVTLLHELNPDIEISPNKFMEVINDYIINNFNSVRSAVREFAIHLNTFMVSKPEEMNTLISEYYDHIMRHRTGEEIKE